MANIKSQKKRIITSEKARLRNRAIRSELRTAIRATREAVAAGEGLLALEKGHYACKLLDRAVTKGVIHKNQAANRKSGLMKLVATVATDEDRAAYKAPAKKQAPATGNKKAAAKAERKAAMKAASEAKAVRREATLKAEKAAAERKAAEAAAAAAAEAEAAQDAE